MSVLVEVHIITHMEIPKGRVNGKKIGICKTLDKAHISHIPMYVFGFAILNTSYSKIVRTSSSFRVTIVINSSEYLAKASFTRPSACALSKFF